LTGILGAGIVFVARREIVQGLIAGDPEAK